MGRTCLIFTIQLSPASYLMIQEIRSNIKEIQRVYLCYQKFPYPIVFTSFEPIIKDLQEIILQYKTNNFKFNGYILKMSIVKCEFILSELQLDESQQAIDVYHALKNNYIKLLKLFSDCIESI